MKCQNLQEDHFNLENLSPADCIMQWL